MQNQDPETFALFTAPGDFFLAADVRVKYEMLRAHAMDGVSATAAAAAHGYSRAFYLVSAAFERSGMTGLLDERPGRRGPVKITPEILAILMQAPVGEADAELAGQVAARFGVEFAWTHGGTAPAAIVFGRGRAFWPVGEAAQADDEALREQVLVGEPASSVSAARCWAGHVRGGARTTNRGWTPWPLGPPSCSELRPAGPPAQ